MYELLSEIPQIYEVLTNTIKHTPLYLIVFYSVVLKVEAGIAHPLIFAIVHRWSPNLKFECLNLRFEHPNLRSGRAKLIFGRPNLRFWRRNLRFGATDCGAEILNLGAQI